MPAQAVHPKTTNATGTTAVIAPMANRQGFGLGLVADIAKLLAQPAAGSVFPIYVKAGATVVGGVRIRCTATAVRIFLDGAGQVQEISSDIAKASLPASGWLVIQAGVHDDGAGTEFRYTTAYIQDANDEKLNFRNANPSNGGGGGTDVTLVVGDYAAVGSPHADLPIDYIWLWDPSYEPTAGQPEMYSKPDPESALVLGTWDGALSGGSVPNGQAGGAAMAWSGASPADVEAIAGVWEDSSLAPVEAAGSESGATASTQQVHQTNAHAVFDDAEPTVSTTAVHTVPSLGAPSSAGSTCTTNALHTRSVAGAGSNLGATVATTAIAEGAVLGSRSSAGATCSTLAIQAEAAQGAASAIGATCTTQAVSAASPGYVEVASVYVNNRLYPAHRGLYLSNDNLLELHGVRHSETRALFATATGSVHLRDKNGDDVEGTTWPKSLLPVQGEPGEYLVQIPHTAELIEGRPYRADVVLVGPAGERAALALSLVGEVRTQ